MTFLSVAFLIVFESLARATPPSRWVRCFTEDVRASLNQAELTGQTNRSQWPRSLQEADILRFPQSLRVIPDQKMACRQYMYAGITGNPDSPEALLISQYGEALDVPFGTLTRLLQEIPSGVIEITPRPQRSALTPDIVSSKNLAVHLKPRDQWVGGLHFREPEIIYQHLSKQNPEHLVKLESPSKSETQSASDLPTGELSKPEDAPQAEPEGPSFEITPIGKVWLKLFLEAVLQRPVGDFIDEGAARAVFHLPPTQPGEPAKVVKIYVPDLGLTFDSAAQTQTSTIAKLIVREFALDEVLTQEGVPGPRLYFEPEWIKHGIVVQDFLDGVSLKEYVDTKKIDIESVPDVRRVLGIYQRLRLPLAQYTLTTAQMMLTAGTQFPVVGADTGGTLMSNLQIARLPDGSLPEPHEAQVFRIDH